MEHISRQSEAYVQWEILIFQCIIGGRVSDLKNLKKASVANKAVEYITRKTKEDQPLMNESVTILGSVHPVLFIDAVRNATTHP